jgi:succinyl-CoA synthetase beta subunit
MPALPEHLTRTLLGNEGVPIVDGVFVTNGSDIFETLPKPPVFLKAQIPGAKNRAAQGLVRRAETQEQLKADLIELLAPGDWGRIEGVLVTEAVNMVGEYYMACMVDAGSAEKLPGGVLLFSTEGGSGVEERSAKLRKIHFSLLNPPTADTILEQLENVKNVRAIGSLLERIVRTFIRYRLIVLEVNPIGVMEDGSLLVIDCLAEFEKNAVRKSDQDLFVVKPLAEKEQTRLEQLVEKINEAEPAGTAFVRENREPAPEGAFRVATNLCGGGGKMLWEMTTGARGDIHSMNESDTSGGLSAFKSYRVLRAILELEGAQVLLLTGSGMAFQNQYHLAAAVWKALRESPTPLPALLRFGGTDENLARELIEKVAPGLIVKVKTFMPHVFPSAMVDMISDVAANVRVQVTPGPEPTGRPAFSVKMPPGDFYYYPEKWTQSGAPPSVGVCPTHFLTWNTETRKIEPGGGARCIGCLLCETISLLEGNSELHIQLDMPEVA